MWKSPRAAGGAAPFPPGSRLGDEGMERSSKEKEFWVLVGRVPSVCAHIPEIPNVPGSFHVREAGKGGILPL